MSDNAVSLIVTVAGMILLGFVVVQARACDDNQVMQRMLRECITETDVNKDLCEKLIIQYGSHDEKNKKD